MTTRTTLNNEYQRLIQFLPIDHPKVQRIVQELQARTGLDCRQLIGDPAFSFFQDVAEREEEQDVQQYRVIWR